MATTLKTHPYRAMLTRDVVSLVSGFEVPLRAGERMCRTAAQRDAFVAAINGEHGEGTAVPLASLGKAQKNK